MINLSDEHAEALRELLEIVLADKDNSMGVIDATSGGGCGPADVEKIRAQWWAVYNAVCQGILYTPGVTVELVAEEGGKVWVRAVTAGRATPGGEPLVHFLRPDGTPSATAVGWPAEYMRLVK